MNLQRRQNILKFPVKKLTGCGWGRGMRLPCRCQVRPLVLSQPIASSLLRCLPFLCLGQCLGSFWELRRPPPPNVGNNPIIFSANVPLVLVKSLIPHVSPVQAKSRTIIGFLLLLLASCGLVAVHRWHNSCWNSVLQVSCNLFRVPSRGSTQN